MGCFKVVFCVCFLVTNLFFSLSLSLSLSVCVGPLHRIKPNSYELATKDNVKKILKKSSDEIACYSSGKKFSAAVWRYYCTHSGHFYCESETVRDQVVVEAGSSRTKPARYYKGSLKIIKNMEVRRYEKERKKKFLRFFLLKFFKFFICRS